MTSHGRIERTLQEPREGTSQPRLAGRIAPRLRHARSRCDRLNAARCCDGEQRTDLPDTAIQGDQTAGLEKKSSQSRASLKSCQEKGAARRVGDLVGYRPRASIRKRVAAAPRAIQTRHRPQPRLDSPIEVILEADADLRHRTRVAPLNYQRGRGIRRPPVTRRPQFQLGVEPTDSDAVAPALAALRPRSSRPSQPAGARRDRPAEVEARERQ